jgi:hypothetical protein
MAGVSRTMQGLYGGFYNLWRDLRAELRGHGTG